MITFLEQSIRHKMELKKERDNEIEEFSKSSCGVQYQDTLFKNSERTEKDAMLLYGSAYPNIIAMEATHLAALDNRKDYKKCFYWPNIPLHQFSY